MRGTVELSNDAAEALTDIVGHVGRVNVSMETMAWLWFVAQELPDTEQRFPRGKWATLQHIEGQLRGAAKDAAAATEESEATLAGRADGGSE